MAVKALLEVTIEPHGLQMMQLRCSRFVDEEHNTIRKLNAEARVIAGVAITMSAVVHQLTDAVRMQWQAEHPTGE